MTDQIDIISVVWRILHLIGSAMPLAILCYIIVFIAKSRKVKNSTVVSYIVVAVLMFLILLRT